MSTPPDGGVLVSEKLPLDYTHSSAAMMSSQVGVDHSNSAATS